MTTIEIKNRFTDSVMYSHTCENNTIKITLEKAVKENADLRGANLENAYLEYADLENANLENANLEYADLENANLENANLEYADLENANLRGADLRDANLRCVYLENADLKGADLRGAVKVPIFCKWSHGITNGNLIHIGCEKKTIEEWDSFFKSKAVISTERGTKEFKQIQAVFEAYKSYLNHLNS